MPAATVSATYASGSDTVTLTAEVAGKPFLASFGLGSNTTATLPAYPTTTNSTTSTTDLVRCILGITQREPAEALTSVTSLVGSYRANAMMRVIRRGEVFVSNSQTIVEFQPVYVETSGSDAGLMYNSSSATRILLPREKLQFVRDVSNESKAVVRIAA
jgi:hypothetical protein